MYPPPPKEVIQQLANRVLEVVSHGEYIIHMGFENGIKLSFEAPFRFADGKDLSAAPVLEFPLSESRFVRTLGCQVRKVKCEADGTLELRFSNGDVLVVYANDPGYEAYTLSVGEKEYIV
jgi:hypothetical protein